MKNNGTHEGNIQEINDIKYINSHKVHYKDYFLKFDKDISNLFLTRVTTKQYSKLSSKKVMTRADAYCIKIANKDLLKLVSKSYFLDEDILSKYKNCDYKIIPKSGISIKLATSKNFQILKLTPHSFNTLFGNYELGAGASLYCLKQHELIKNRDLLIGWNTSINKMIMYFKTLNLSSNFINNKEECKKIKNFSNTTIKSIINKSLIIQKKIFNGIYLYEEPYTAYYFYKNKSFSSLNYLPFFITTGSNRTKGNYTIVLKPLVI